MARDISSRVRLDFDIGDQVTWDIPKTPKNLIAAFDFPGIGLVVGSSGSGKSCALRDRYGAAVDDPVWTQEEVVCDHFHDYDSAVALLGMAGLNSIPQWLKPYHILSTGERARANIALGIDRGQRAFDEFTSTVGRPVAKAICIGLNRAAGDRNLVFATCHYDVVEWLDWNWCYDFDTGEVVTDGEAKSVGWRVFLKDGIEVDGYIQRH